MNRTYYMMIILVFSLIILVGCSNAPSESEIQTAIAQTQASSPTNTPIPTNTSVPTITPVPTLTAEQIYCNNIDKFFDDTIPHRASLVEFVNFLESDSIYGDGQLTWGEWLDLTIKIGPLGSSTWRQESEGEAKEAFEKLVTLSRDIEEKGIKLQMALSRETPPQSVELAHQKILECYSDATDSVASIANFLESDEVIYELPGFESCNRLDLYIEEIGIMCKKQSE